MSKGIEVQEKVYRDDIQRLVSRGCVAQWSWEGFVLGVTKGKVGWEESTKCPECLAK